MSFLPCPSSTPAVTACPGGRRTAIRQSCRVRGHDKQDTCCNNAYTMCDFRLPPQRERNLRSSEMLCIVDLQLVTDVSGQPIGPIFKGQTASHLKMVPTGCPETSVTNCKVTLCNIPEERRFHLLTFVTTRNVIFLLMSIAARWNVR